MESKSISLARAIKIMTERRDNIGLLIGKIGKRSWEKADGFVYW